MTMFDPFREFQSLRREVDRAISNDGAPRLAFLPGRSARHYPLCNIYDDGDNLFVEALIPGVEPAAMEVTIVGNILTIGGEKPGLKDAPPEKVHRSERAAGRFLRTLSLPVEVERDRVEADYSNGMLMLTMPRSEASKPKRVMINSSGDSHRNN